jgi:uncharacterized caspase-like protein
MLSLLIGAGALAHGQTTPVRGGHLQRIQELLQANGLRHASVVLDNRGRVELQGSYENESEVDFAFSIAQTIVGVRWVSPVTPQRIRVKQWMLDFQRLFEKQAEASALRPDTPPGPIQGKYALIVGVGQFQDGRITTLQYPAKDAKDMYRYLVSPSGGGFQASDVVLLQDAQATRSAVVQALEHIKAQAGPDDLVILYLSSHGTPPDKFGGVHMVTYDTVVKPREHVWHTSVNEDVLHTFIQEVRTKRLILILDACYSNGAYARVPGFLPVGGKSLESHADEGYGRSQLYMAQRLLGMKALVVDAAPRTAVGVGQGWGKVLMSASDAGERSWELNSLQNSVFTYYFLEGMGRYRGNIKAAFEYAKPLVLQKVQLEKGREITQTPQVISSQPAWAISLAARGS